MKKIFDISMPLTAKTPVWPTSEKFRVVWVKNISEDNVNESTLAFNTHTGTHLDMPYHFLQSGMRAGDVQLKCLIGKALVAEYSGKGDITPEFLKTVKLPARCRKLLLKTRNSSIPGNTFRKNFIALSPEGAEWIVRKGIDLVGIDYLSIQKFDDRENRTHKILLQNKVLILEGLRFRNVKKGIYTLFALPLNVIETEGAPVRAVLVME